DVEHGACAILCHHTNGIGGRLAMIDSGCTDEWCPSEHITRTLQRTRLDYLFITNPDQDHMSDLQGLWNSGIHVNTVFLNRSYTGNQYCGIKQQGGALTNDALRYATLCNEYIYPVTEPFDAHMGGIIARA